MKFIPVELRRKLPTFSLQCSLPSDPQLQAYRQYYQLDFEQQRLNVRCHMGTTQVAGFNIVVHAYVPVAARATVVLLHGYYDHVGLYRHIIKYLLKQNVAVVTFDLPGHGLSSGMRAMITSFHQYQPVLKQVLLLTADLPGPWFGLAQSTGAAILAEFILEAESAGYGNPFQKAVFYAPLLRPVHWFLNQQLHRLVSPFRKTVKRKFSESSNDPDFVYFVKHNDPLQSHYLSAQWVGALKQWIPFMERHQGVQFPLLIFQGKSDGTVDWRHNIPVYERLFSPTRVVYLPHARHHVVNELEIYRKDVFCRTLQYFLES